MMDENEDIEIDEESDYTSSHLGRLCEVCQKISAEALTSEDGFTHAANPSVLFRAAPRCDLCNMLWAELDPHMKSKAWKNLRLKIRLKNDSRGVYMVLAAVLDDDLEEARSLDNFAVWTPVEDPATRYRIPTLATGLSNTKSPETFNFIRTCLKECREHDCGLPLLPGSEKTVPSRLLYVGGVSPDKDQDDDFVRLIDTGDAHPTYITLSHCWGSNLERYKTTSKNLSQQKIAIYLRDTTQNFRDAIHITRRLGVNYLWIDALCIVQDSTQEWAEESVKMGEIYQNSQFTISASHAQDGTGGCFNQMSNDGLDEWSINIATEDDAGEKSTVIIRPLPSIQMEPAPLRKGSLRNRGWIYQERILSPRTVHFTASQAVWECRKAYRLECLMPCDTPTLSSFLGRGNVLQEMTVNRWYNDIVNSRVADFGYSHRLFTKYEDRLVALSCIAKICHHYMKDRYVAGLWAKHLAYGLGWMHTYLRDRRKDVCCPRSPSWSWASHDGPISWRGYPEDFIADKGFSLVCTDLEYYQTTQNEFSPVIGGSILVTGRLVHVRQLGISRPDFMSVERVELHGEAYSGDFWLDYPLGSDSNGIHGPSDLPALLLGNTGPGGSRYFDLLVLGPHAGDNAYVRLGVATVWFTSSDAANRFADASSTGQLRLF